MAPDETLPPCPTPCDDDCELDPDGCHESHQVPWKRVHQPEGCQEIRHAIAAAVAAERERIAKLADEHEAVWDDSNGHTMYFAPLIREQP